MSDPNDAAALTAVVLDEEEARRQAQAEAEAGEILPDDLLPGVGGPPMRLRAGLASGGFVMIFALLLVSMVEELDQVALQVLAPDIQRTLDISDTTLLGTASSFGGVVLVLATLPFAWLADRYVRTRMLAARPHCGRRSWRSPAWSPTVSRWASRARARGSAPPARIPIAPSLIADQYPIDVRTRMFAIGEPRAARPGSGRRPVLRRRGRGGRAGGQVEGWRWAMFVVAVPRRSSRSSCSSLREPERGRNEQEAMLGQARSTPRGSAGAAQRRRRRA